MASLTALKQEVKYVLELNEAELQHVKYCLRARAQSCQLEASVEQINRNILEVIDHG